MALVFQYGSNVDPNRLNSADRLRGEARPIGLALTCDSFRLDFRVASRQNRCAAADLVPDPAGRQIFGAAYEIPDDLVFRQRARSGRRSLDEIESEGRNYRRVALRVSLRCDASTECAALTYLALAPKPGIRTSRDYVAHILAGLRAHRAPQHYIDYVLERVQRNNPSLSDLS